MVDTKNAEIYNALIKSARKIGILAEKEALEADKNAILSENVINLIKEEGIHRLILPESYGHPQIDFKIYTDLIRTVGYYNLSAAWLTYFYSLHNSWTTFLPKHRMDEIINEGGLLADIFAPVGSVEKVEGGYLLSGKWNFVSGINYSSWVAVGAVREVNGVPDRICLCMRVSDLQLVQEWNSIGLRGSGSNTLIADNLFVPEDLVFSHMEVAMGQAFNPTIEEDYLYKYAPFFPAFFVGFPAMSLGAAERVLDEFKERTKKRVRMDGTNEGQSPKSQRVLAELTLKYKAANGLMNEYIQMLESRSNAHHPAEYNAIRVKIVQYCVDIAVKATLTLGASALIKGHPLEMITRDLIAVGAHITSLYEDGIDHYGKTLFDVETFCIG
ncbi:flavin-dependent monooxygenase [Lysinibacillus yapensis]|uniref:Flavin-dependent monooxygenase n=1 Tax=Ureibacillus yapensis TaxID=2304605 RepID=A0A396S9M6_9BACL|nr:acyl-CoA dehydrogenase family protein [Lysinibacillus yapensis]RHW37471.1 flavin-dependent monooxygenase [Lysinibacillus yapensis]